MAFIPKLFPPELDPTAGDCLDLLDGGGLERQHDLIPAQGLHHHPLLEQPKPGL